MKKTLLFWPLTAALIVFGACMLALTLLGFVAAKEKSFQLYMSAFDGYVTGLGLLYLGIQLARRNLFGVLMGAFGLVASLILHLIYVAIYELSSIRWPALLALSLAYIGCFFYVRSSYFRQFLRPPHTAE